MAELKIKERIEKEETRKVKYIIIGIIIIFFAWIIINLVLKISYLGKLVSGIVLLIVVLYLGFEWYRAYHK
ncbi:hypothetical protein KY348_00680 [Candidatus Woesearchaeota archaeon]|nr:hypothetical protein [Candidatus Woesearchaeota archaeon]